MNGESEWTEGKPVPENEMRKFKDQVSHLGHPLVDEVMPEGKWRFDEDVAGVFEDMLERSIPQYQLMRELVFRIGTQFRQTDTAIWDLGCSQGAALERFVREPHADLWRNKYVGFEVSAPMREAAEERFADEDVEIINSNLATDFLSKFYAEHETPSLVLCVLTLQFTPIEYRHRILRRIYQVLRPGGALILVEKVLGDSAEMNQLLNDLYYDGKREQGYTDDQIERKRLSLEGFLVPVTHAWNEELMLKSGFDELECFWRCLNFSAWIAVKR